MDVIGHLTYSEAHIAAAGREEEKQKAEKQKGRKQRGRKAEGSVLKAYYDRLLWCGTHLKKVFSDREKGVSAILAFEFTPNQTRINPECSPKVPRRYYEGTTKVLPLNFTLTADALAGAFNVKARRRKGVKSQKRLVPDFV